MRQVFHATAQEMEAWAELYCGQKISEDKALAGLLLLDAHSSLHKASGDQMDFSPRMFYAVTGSMGSHDEGVLRLSLQRVVRHNPQEWGGGRTYTYSTKLAARPNGARLEYTAIRVKCAGRDWVFTDAQAEVIA